MSRTCLNVTNLSSWEPPFNTHVNRSNHSQLVQVNTSQNVNEMMMLRSEKAGPCFVIHACAGKLSRQHLWDLWEDYLGRWDHHLTSDSLSSKDSVLSNSGKQWITNTILRAVQPRTSSQYCYKNNTFLEITLNSSVVSHQFHPCSPPQHWKPLLITEKC